VDKDNFAGAVAATGNNMILGAPGAKIGSNTKQGALYIESLDSLGVSINLPATASSGGVDFLSHVTVSNSTNVTAAPVAVSILVPAGAHVVSASTSQGTCTLVSTTYSCLLTGIPAKGTGTVNVTLQTASVAGFQMTQFVDTANTRAIVIGSGKTLFTLPVPPSKSGGGVQDLWSLGFLAWMVMLGMTSGRRRSPSG
jgi:hypothetical protein